MQNNANVWPDVTMEILNYGIGGANLPLGAGCGDPKPNAIIRLAAAARHAASTAPATMAASTTSARATTGRMRCSTRAKALQRDTARRRRHMILGGVMHYVALDVTQSLALVPGRRRLRRRQRAERATTPAARDYSVYFSDRRNNRNVGEPGDRRVRLRRHRQPRGRHRHAERRARRRRGRERERRCSRSTASFRATTESQQQRRRQGRPRRSTAARPDRASSCAAASRKANRAVLFRHALKLVNGEPRQHRQAPGLTIVAENPVYIQGDWNAIAAAGFGNPHVATSVIADAVTLLGNAWNDNNSFANPYNPGAPRARDTYYRVAIIAGKSPSFPLPGWRGDRLRHRRRRAQLPALSRDRAATGQLPRLDRDVLLLAGRRPAPIKCCTTVYGAPTRNYQFDIDFLDPTLLPPLTPVFRDLNTLGFSQEIRPGK